MDTETQVAEVVVETPTFLKKLTVKKVAIATTVVVATVVGAKFLKDHVSVNVEPSALPVDPS